jgi:5-methylcytosine-specific restriction endonuclease McrA
MEKAEYLCVACGQLKMRGSFCKEKRNRNGITSVCRACESIRALLWQRNNREKVLSSSMRWNKANPGKMRAATKKWILAHPEKIGQWAKNNPDKIKVHRQKMMKKRLSTARGKLFTNMHAGIYQSVKKGTKQQCHWETLVNYSVADLKVHLEKQFTEGMSWDNYGRRGWHIDHIIPVSVFNFEKPSDIDFKKCWALDNLQPLWERENLKKHAKLSRPFQPSLLMGGTLMYEELRGL